MLDFEIVAQGTRWPSGDFRDVAVLPISDSEVREVFGELTEGTEPGLGDWLAIGFKLPDQSLIELINYKASPLPTGYILRLDKRAHTEPSLSHVLSAFGLSKDALSWLNAGP